MEADQLNKFIVILEETKTKLSDNISSIENGCNTVSAMVNRFYGDNNIHEKNLKEIKVFSKFCHVIGESPFGHTLSGLRGQLEGIINDVIRESNDLGLPEISKKNAPNKSITVTNVLSQTQTQNIEIQILDSLKHELTGKQYEEIQFILKEDDKSKTKEKLFKTLKSFGESVLASVVANIITNHSNWLQ